MLSDAQLAALEALAMEVGKPIATMAYDFVARGLRGRARRSR